MDLLSSRADQSATPDGPSLIVPQHDLASESTTRTRETRNYLIVVVASRAMEQDDQHILLDIMESVSFGQDAAENEDNLQEVFVAGTEVY
mgnify:CR=1 FL=1